MAIQEMSAFLLELFHGVLGSPTAVLIFVCTALLSYYAMEYYQRPSNYPPGPWRIPIIGTTAILTKFLPEAMKNPSEKYGDVMSFPMGSQTWMILGSAEVVQEAFRKLSDITSGRPKEDFYHICSEKGQGISLADSPVTRQHKRFLMKSMKNLGSGRPVTEQRINNILEEFLSQLRDLKGQPINPRGITLHLIFKVIAVLNFGAHYRPTEAEIESYINNSVSFVDAAGVAVLGDVFPFLKYIPGDFCKYGAVQKCIDYFKRYVGGQIDRHRKDDLKPVDESRGYVDIFLKQAEELGEAAENNGYTDKQLIFTVLEVITAGMDTSSNTTCFTLLYCLHHPEVQQRVVDELNSVFPGNTIPTTSLRNECPYTEAFILEVLRMSSVLPMGLHHRVKESITIGNHCVPKNATLVANFWKINHDERVFKNAYDFDPGHFLDDAGKLDPKPTQFFPFSVGRRACAGEELARMQLFLIITNIIKNFHIGLPAGDALPSTWGRFGLVTSTYPFNVVFTPRSTAE